MYDFVQGDPSWFIVMEYVNGETLRRSLDAERRFEWKKAAQVVYLLTDALAYAHDQNILHRRKSSSSIFTSLLPRHANCGQNYQRKWKR